MQEYFWRLVLDKLFKQIVFFNFISLPSRTLSGAEWSLTSFVWPINRTLWVTCNPQFMYPARQCPVTRSQETKAMNMIVKVPFWTVMVEHNQGSKFICATARSGLTGPLVLQAQANSRITFLLNLSSIQHKAKYICSNIEIGPRISEIINIFETTQVIKVGP